MYRIYRGLVPKKHLLLPFILLLPTIHSEGGKVFYPSLLEKKWRTRELKGFAWVCNDKRHISVVAKVDW